MTCEEMIYSNDYADYMINYFDEQEGADEQFQNACVNPIIDKIAILHMKKPRDYMTNLERTPYSFIPKLFGLMDSSNMEAVGVKQVKSNSGIGITGKNVIVGFVDTGIDYTNPLFLGADGSTRIGVIWDQSIENSSRESDDNLETDEVSNKSITDDRNIPIPLYGTVFAKSQIEEALIQENPYEIVPSRDENGHGTFMTGIVAGGENRENDFVGIASDAEIAVVKLKEAKPYLKEYFGVPQTATAYQETDVMYAVEYLLRYADARNLPISIYIGVGSSNGGHNGLTYLERYLTNILENPGIMISVPAGNEGNERLHYAGDMAEEEDMVEVEFNIAEGQETLVLEFWGDAPTTFAVGLVSPQGDRIERIPPRFGKEEVLRLPLAKSTIYVAYQMIETYSGDELIFIRITNPIAGLWKLLVSAADGRKRTFNIWMPLRQFLQRETYFLRAEPNNTITNPGNAPLVTTMTAYNHLNGSVYAESGRGFISKQLVKPDMAAPGVDVTGPGLRKNYVTKTGTSVAAAHAAGIFALFLQWNQENTELGELYAAQIQNLFYKSATRSSDMNYPSIIWGYGIINAQQVFEQFRIIET
ncbi:MAG: S8 family peptidase [Lachnospiraceae bacterium]|nr:S8 family peptidase [Lachnospiraceae bacterium]